MKIKKVAAICRSNKTLVICRRDGRQLIGNGHALYELRGLPQMKPEEMLRMFDDKEDQMDSWYIPGIRDMEHYDFRDDVEAEEDLRMDLPLIGSGGDLLWPLEAESGEIIFVNSELLKPIESEMMCLTLRRTAAGSPYVVVKDGFLLEAMIMPYAYMTQRLCDQMKRVWEGCCYAYAHHSDTAE